jgi:hypothetical protein
MELQRFTKVRFVIKDDKEVSRATAEKRLAALSKRFPEASDIDVSPAGNIACLTFLDEDAKQLYTDAAMKHIVETILEKFP